MPWPPPPVGGQPSAPAEGFPPPAWPSKAQLEYVRTLVIVVLLLIALPWVAVKLFTDPASLLAGAGQRVVKSGPVT